MAVSENDDDEVEHRVALLNRKKGELFRGNISVGIADPSLKPLALSTRTIDNGP
jgi:hypothetical protein